MNDNILSDRKTLEMKRTIIERNMVVNGTHVHVKSIFNGKLPLEKALGNIAVRKLSAKKKI